MAMFIIKQFAIKYSYFRQFGKMHVFENFVYKLESRFLAEDARFTIVG